MKEEKKAKAMAAGVNLSNEDLDDESAVSFGCLLISITFELWICWNLS